MSLSIKLSRTKRLIFVIVACSIYFVFEIAVGLKTGSLALIVDVSISSIIVALVATRLTMSSRMRPGFTFALKRCEILGAFFNATILLALAVSIFLQSIERFIDVPEVEDPMLVFIVGCVGLGLNAVCILVCHDGHGHHGHSHGHSHGHDHYHSHARDQVDNHNHDHAHSPDHHHHANETAHQDSQHDHSFHSHRHEHEQTELDEGVYSYSLEDEVRAVRIPSLFTQVARPISHLIHDHHNHHHDSARPAAATNRSSRCSRWRSTRIHKDLEAHPQLGQSHADIDLKQKPTKHRSLDPGSPKYVLPDSQRWYDSAQTPRMPSREAEEISRESSKDGDISLASMEGYRAGPREHRRQEDGKRRDPDHDHDLTRTHPNDPHYSHGHGHSHANLGFAGVILHLIGDAVNNIGVIIAAVVMWQSTSPSRFYADPAVSVAIGLIIFGGSLPLTFRSARVLLEAAPKGLDLQKVQDELMTISGVTSIHCLHIWQLTESDLIGSVEVRSNARDLVVWSLVEKEIRRHLASHGINHLTISPEFVPPTISSGGTGGSLQVDVEESKKCVVLQ